MTKLRSAAITDGVQRAPNRAMLRAVGFGDDDFDKPIVGVANGYSTITPCNAGLRPLADARRRRRARRGRHAAGLRHDHRQRRHHDGHQGMKYSLVSREVIADSIETVVRRPEHRRRARHRRLRQEHARRADGHGAPEHPGDLRLRRHASCPATCEGQRPRHRVSIFEAVGQFSAGQDRPRRSCSRSSATPAPARAPAAACTPPTPCPRPSRRWAWPALFVDHGGRGRREGARAPPRRRDVLVDARRQRNLRPRDILTRKAFENAITVVMALGGSTNAVLHLLAIAHAAGVPLDARRLRAHRRAGARALRPEAVRPLRGDRPAPGRRRSAVMKMLLANGLLHGDCAHHHRPDDRRETRRRCPTIRRADQDVIRPLDRPLYAAGPSGDPARQSRRRGRGGQDRRREDARITGPARVFDSRGGVPRGDPRRPDQTRRRAGHPRRGTEGRPRHARDARADRGHHRRRAWASRSASSPTAASPAAPTAWWSATSRRRRGSAAPSRWSRRATRSPSTPTPPAAARRDRAELARRRAAWKPPAPRYTPACCYKYAKLVSSASLGAVTDG